MRDPWSRGPQRAQPWVGAILLPSTRPAESPVHSAGTASVRWPSRTPLPRAGTTQTTEGPNVYVCASRSPCFLCRANSRIESNRALATAVIARRTRLEPVRDIHLIRSRRLLVVLHQIEGGVIRQVRTRTVPLGIAPRVHHVEDVPAQLNIAAGRPTGVGSQPSC